MFLTKLFSIRRKNIFVSLGSNCFTKFFAVHSGLKPLHKYGEFVLPFDNIYIPDDGVAKSLNKDFIDFVDKITYDETSKIYRNIEYGAIFFHDNDCDNSITGLEKIKNRYKKRIANYYDLVKNGDVCIYIITCCRSKQTLEQIYFKLKDLHSRFALIAIDYCKCLSDVNHENLLIIPYQGDYDITYFWKAENKQQTIEHIIYLLDNSYDFINNYLSKKNKYKFSRNKLKKELNKRLFHNKNALYKFLQRLKAKLKL